MDKETQKKINKANRKRGANFEKVGADFLDMDVVPYSGSNARFGYGDVRDTIWLGEFKNITPKDNQVTIKQSWLDKNLERANDIGRLSFLAWMPAGRSTKYVIIDSETFNRFNSTSHIYSIQLEKKSHNTKNLIFNITDKWIKSMTINGGICNINNQWYMMRIELFKDIIIKNKLKGVRSGVLWK